MKSPNCLLTIAYLCVFMTPLVVHGMEEGRDDNNFIPPKDTSEKEQNVSSSLMPRSSDGILNDGILMQAISAGDGAAVVQAMLDGADPNAAHKLPESTGNESSTPLMQAIRLRKTVIIELLIAGVKVQGKRVAADVNMLYSDENSPYYTALHKAVALADPDGLALLLRYGANPLIQDRDGKTPIDCAQGISALLNKFTSLQRFRNTIGRRSARVPVINQATEQGKHLLAAAESSARALARVAKNQGDHALEGVQNNIAVIAPLTAVFLYVLLYYECLLGLCGIWPNS
jgi:ankyrin repeat protein